MTQSKNLRQGKFYRIVCNSNRTFCGWLLGVATQDQSHWFVDRDCVITKVSLGSVIESERLKRVVDVPVWSKDTRDDFTMFVFRVPDEPVSVVAGCRNFSVAAAIDHWSQPARHWIEGECSCDLCAQRRKGMRDERKAINKERIEFVKAGKKFIKQQEKL